MVDPVRLWAEQILISWRPALPFFQNRFAFLGKLKESSLLTAFRVRPDHGVEARLDQNRYEVSLGSTDLRISALVRDANWEVVNMIMNEGLIAAQPETVTLVSSDFAHLTELRGEYKEVCRRAVGTWFGPWSDGIGLVDHATLIDGETDESTYQIEFGVVSRAEIQFRLERRAGRLAGDPIDLTANWVDDEAPRVALFSGSFWQASSVPEPGTDIGEWVGSFRNNASGHAVRIVEKLKESIESAE